MDGNLRVLLWLWLWRVLLWSARFMFVKMINFEAQPANLNLIPILYCFKFVFWLLMTKMKTKWVLPNSKQGKNQQIMDDFFRAPGQWSPQQALLSQGRIWKCSRQWIFWYWRKCFEWNKIFFFMTLMAIILPFNQAGFPSLGPRTSFPAALGAAGPLKGDKT